MRFDDGDKSRARRLKMVDKQLVPRAIHDRRVLDAMRVVPRERFVAPRRRRHAYEDRALPIEAGQTISQPYVVALMAQALELRAEDRVLEVGSGSGYATAILALIAGEVFAIERHELLVELSRERLASLQYENVRIAHADGSLGWPEYAPFDAISVAAGGPEVADPLLAQLAVGGRLVMPVESKAGGQELIRVRRTSDDVFESESLGRVQFVPLIGEAGWDGSQSSESD